MSCHLAGAAHGEGLDLSGDADLAVMPKPCSARPAPTKALLAIRTIAASRTRNWASPIFML